MLSLRNQTNPFAYSCSFTSHTSYKNGFGGGGGECSKTINYKTYLELILYKPVGKYQFTMACIRTLVMIVYQVINCLIYQPKHKL